MLRKLQLRHLEKGSFYMILSVVASTVFAIFAKESVKMIQIPLMIFLRFALPFLFILPYFYRHLSTLKEISYKTTFKHVMRAFAVVISQYSLFYYFTRASLTDGILLWNTAPLFMPVIMFVFYRHKVSRVVWLSLLVSFIGVICVLKPTSALFDPFSFYGFLSGFAVACSQVLYGVNRENESLSVNIFLFFLYTSLLSGIAFALSLRSENFTDILVSSFVTKGTLLPIAAVLFVSIGTICNQALRGTAFKYAKPASLGPLTYLSVVFAGIIEYFVQPGEVGFLFVIGILLVFLGTLIKISERAKA